jgi:hypothetical protein
VNPSTQITLNLTLREVEGIMAGLGELPTSTGVFPILLKVKAQAETQLPKEEPKVEAPAAE